MLRLLTIKMKWEKAPDDIQFSLSDAFTNAAIQLKYESALIEEVEVLCSEPKNFSPPDCDNHLETTMSMMIHTEDGALNETFEVTYKAYSTEEVRWSSSRLDYTDFNGNFKMPQSGDVILQDQPIDALYLGFYGHVIDGESGGSFMGHTETNQDDGTGSGFVFPVATY